MKMMERKAYTGFGETGFGKMGFGKMGFSETGKHRSLYFCTSCPHKEHIVNVCCFCAIFIHNYHPIMHKR